MIADKEYHTVRALAIKYAIASGEVATHTLFFAGWPWDVYRVKLTPSEAIRVAGALRLLGTAYLESR